MQIVTKEISGIASAIYDMRKPMESESDSVFKWDNEGLKLEEIGLDDLRLAKKLALVKPGSGHNCFLKDIVVHMDMTMPHDFLLQYYRYHFTDTASSTSKMHSIHKGDIKDKCQPYVSNETITLVNRLIKMYNHLEDNAYYYNEDYFRDILLIDAFPETKKELFECIIANTPLGYMLTLGEVTNYLQLQSMWNQRKNHKMSSWNTVFVNWVRSLPMSYLITGEE